MIIRKTTLISLLVLLFGVSNAQQPISSRGSNYVNEFSGDFNYSVPLVTVTGPNGEAFPLTVTYQSGISVDQNASWIGLGWDLDLGQISRTVNGVPDDWDGQISEHYKINYNSGYALEANNKKMFGPLYFCHYDESSATNKYMDTYVSDFMMPVFWTKGFEFADYDNYQVSGPGIGGSMTPHLFEYANLHNSTHSDDNFAYVPDGTINHTDVHWFTDWVSANNDNHRPQFHLRGHDLANVDMPYFSDPTQRSVEVNSIQTNHDPNWMNPLKIQQNQNYTNRHSDQSGTALANNRVKTTQFVEYYTNQEILNQQNSNSFYPNATDFFETDAEGFDRSNLPGGSASSSHIGGFKVVKENGLIYHYSLPVYMKEESFISFPLKDDNFQLRSGNIWEDGSFSRKTNYVTHWKLTAITGHNFVDNGDGKVGPGDEGYWVKIKYAKWAGNFQNRTPYYGYGIDALSRTEFAKVFGQLIYRPNASISRSNGEVYYPEYIQTATQTAYFFKELRRDAHSVENSQSKSIPLLALKKIVLVKNDQFTNAPNANDNYTVPSGISSSVVDINALGTGVLTMDDYSAYATSLEPISREVIEFEQDYSLCKKLYNSYEVSGSFNTYQFNDGGIGSVEVFKDATLLTENNAQRSGKLTLKKVKVYGSSHFQDFPSYEFKYSDQASTPINPDYNHWKKTAYGFYNENSTTYPTGINTVVNTGGFSDNKKEAWSLHEIRTPNNGIIAPVYESDVIEQTQYEGFKGQPTSLSQIFRIKDVSYDASNNKLTFFFLDKEGENFVGNLAVSSKKLHLPITCNTASNSGVDKEVNMDISANPITYEGLTGGEKRYSLIRNTLHVDCISNIQHDNLINEEGYAFIRFKLDELHAGGIRVKEVRISDAESSDVYKRQYTYENGIAPSLPSKFEMREDKENVLTGNRSLADRHGPSKQVGYHKVTVEDIGLDNKKIGKTVNTYTNVDPLWNISSIRNHPSPLSGQNRLVYNVYEVNIASKYIGVLGKPVKNELFDNHGNLIFSREYIYDGVTERGKIDEGMYSALHDDRLLHERPLASVGTYRSVQIKRWITPVLREIKTYDAGAEFRQRFSYMIFTVKNLKLSIT